MYIKIVINIFSILLLLDIKNYFIDNMYIIVIYVILIIIKF